MTINRVVVNRLRLSAVVASLTLAACSSDLPDREEPENIVWLEQNWSEAQRQWFHHADQGTESFLIPLEWFTALEQPGLNIFGASELLADSNYLAELGFIPDPVSSENPHGLPVGFSVGQADAARPGHTPVGLTCAACHTGHMTYQGTSLRYDGGPAMIAPDKLMGALLRSMVETNYNGRQFNRFAEKVLGEGNTEEAAEELKKEFAASLMRLIAFTFSAIEEQQQRTILADVEAGRSSSLLRALAESARDTLQQIEGFARTDALTRIGNQVFALDINRPENFAPVTAPVSFPQIWNSSWFVWVQYDGSIMQPMVRNAGEALGVGALITLDANAPDNFASSVRMDTLHEIESLLAGPDDAFAAQEFSGLRSPAWPEEILGDIDTELATTGAQLYVQHCQSCHLPAPNTAAFWDVRHWSVTNDRGARLLDVPLIPLAQIGTDPEQAAILARRNINTTGLGLDTEVLAGERCEPMRVRDADSASYAFSLGATVQEVISYWYDANDIPANEREVLNGGLPNCLQAPESYKARPLNGIWATSPYLHNGSVPNLYALLSPVEERPVQFHVGNLEFDPENVGYESGSGRGYFLFDTSKRGNSNSGHEFADSSSDRAGIIGPRLEEDERRALVEYLKTL